MGLVFWAFLAVGIFSSISIDLAKAEVMANQKSKSEISKLEALEIAKKSVANRSGGQEFVILEQSITERTYGWVFSYTTKKHLETGDPKYIRPGNGPLVVERLGGVVTFLTTSASPDKTLEEFEKTWKKVHGKTEETATLHYKVLNYQDFHDSKSNDFYFRFPVFLNWELKSIKQTEPSTSIVFFNWPSEFIRYDVAPQIKILKINTLEGGQKDDLQHNPQNIAYSYVSDPSLYTPGYVPKLGAWDYLEFYGKKFTVRISRPHFGSIGVLNGPFDFNQDLFIKEVIESFSWTEGKR